VFAPVSRIGKSFIHKRVTMKTFYAWALAVAVLPFLGCNTSPTGGGEGKDTFKVTGPTMAVSVKQGEAKKEKVSVTRGTDFKQNIAFSTSDAPKGLKVEFEPANVKAGDKAETEMTIKADKDAPLGESTVKVVATPEKGKETTVDVKVKVTDGK